jgi:hypothetical protein
MKQNFFYCTAGALGVQPASGQPPEVIEIWFADA